MRDKLLYSFIAFLILMIPWLPSYVSSGETAQELQRDFTVQIPEVSENLPKILKTETPPTTNLVCRTYCSQHRLRTGVVELSWRTEKKAPPVKQSIQATVYKNGFDDRSFMLFDLDPRKLELSNKARKPVSPIVGLDGMKDLRSSQINLTGFSRDAGFNGLKNRKGSNLAVIENLEPGLVYRFRVLTETNTGLVTGECVSCLAPVCPADITEGN